MTTQRFKTTITRSGSRTYIAIPFDPNEVWGVKQRHYITGIVNGVEAHTEVEVVLMPEGPQADTLAEDIRAALDGQPEARVFFESLATFYRNGYIRWIESAKRPETRSTRIAEMLGLLTVGKKQR